ncbi:MAG TPA: 16S rRNA (guanine(966)-N(2))-methyltransferase RsmD [Tenuifilaceae bacterium]|nr:16S rRNA (guanine(966)-N(2))-methyltransferase RsmD [Tenuifilaceae bacterium]
MRIVGGELKGRIIHPPKNFSARPTTDFAKESLFNILNNYVDFDEVNVLDLFSGTGSISFEFASRGVKNITAVENNYLHFKFIKENAARLGLNSVKVYKHDVFNYIKHCDEKFDIIFADPPYSLDLLETIPDEIFKAGLLNEKGVFILEHSSKNRFANHVYFSEIRSYGSVNFTFFKKNSV